MNQRFSCPRALATCVMLLSLAVSACSAFHAESGLPGVKLDSGTIVGDHAGTVIVFKGIPFAAPPVGALRWRAPEPVPPWEGTRSATRFGPACPQSEQGSWPADFTPIVTDEDCLYLNVWAPPRSHSTRHPVMVWIHGGGWTNGSASAPLYDGQALAASGVVLVSINFRLGALGTLAHPDLSAESEHGVSGNYGILDQIAALQWVRRNISAFGGDPDNVTIFGQSSGSMAISALMTSPLAKGLFHRAIGQSGALMLPLAASPRGGEYRMKGAEEAGARLTAHLGMSAAALRAKPAADFLALRGFSSHPVIDGYVLPDEPYEVFSRGAQHDVPLLVGTTSQEGIQFAASAQSTVAGFQADVSRVFGPLGARLASIYAPGSDSQAAAARVNLEGDVRFGWETRTWALLHARTGRQPAYVYSFDHPGAPTAAKPGASHGDEMRYVFGRSDPGWTTLEEELSDFMRLSWVRFARTGSPNGPGLPEWPSLDPATEEIMVISATPTVRERPDRYRLRQLDEVFDTLRGN